jgi:hypothetical protein
LEEVYEVIWAPTRDMLAFYAYGINYLGKYEAVDAGIYISKFNGRDFETVLVDIERPMCLHWISANELVITKCTFHDKCTVSIYNTDQQTTTNLIPRKHLLHKFIPSLDSYLIFSTGYRNLFLLDKQGNINRGI